MNSDYVKPIAIRILTELKSDSIKLLNWDAKDFCYLNRNIGYKCYPALMFDISDKIVKNGKIIISYEKVLDSYIVELTKSSRDKEVILKKKDKIYLDDLPKILDEMLVTDKPLKKVV